MSTMKCPRCMQVYDPYTQSVICPHRVTDPDYHERVKKYSKEH